MEISYTMQKIATVSNPRFPVAVACVAGRRKGREVKMSTGGRLRYDLLALHALVFPHCLHFGRLPRRLREGRKN